MVIGNFEKFEHRILVYCKLVKTYVDLQFCLRGGPMKAEGKCEHLLEIEQDESGNVISLVHAVPTREALIKSIIRER